MQLCLWWLVALRVEPPKSAMDNDPLCAFRICGDDVSERRGVLAHDPPLSGTAYIIGRSHSKQPRHGCTSATNCTTKSDSLQLRDSYTWEAVTGHDETHTAAPDPRLVHLLQASWTGSNLDFNHADSLIITDPSLREGGPRTLLVRHGHFVDALRRTSSSATIKVTTTDILSNQFLRARQHPLGGCSRADGRVSRSSSASLSLRRASLQCLKHLVAQRG